MKWVVTFAAFGLGTLLIITRLPVHHKASQAAVEITSVGDSIRNKSTVLPLSFSHNGKTPTGALISNRIWLFMHASDYIGAHKSLVMYGNYEANTGNFPLRWHGGLNPFHYMCETPGGIEGQPPCADIQGFRTATGKDVDYVLLTFFSIESANHPQTRNLLDELEHDYDEIAVSTHGRALLYRRKGLMTPPVPD
jgi:hypothetical protein